jgi:SAM-dependent methyltransferase
VADHCDSSGAGADIDIRRVRAEIEAEAAARRRADPELARREREIERAWVEVAPPGAAGEQHELLLDRADRLSMVDVDAPIGARSGIRQVKGAIRKAIYWYLRYVTDQINALTNVLTRLLRRMDERLGAVEHAVGLTTDDSELAGPIPDPSEGTAAAIAEQFGAGQVIVLTSGAGSVVAAASSKGASAYGIDRDPITILPGVEAGLDLRAADPLSHLDSVETNTLGTLVLAGVTETLPLPSIVALCSEAVRCVRPGGNVIVAVANPADRGPVEAELRAGRGLSPAAWVRVLERVGAVARIVPAPGPRITELVVADVS